MKNALNRYVPNGFQPFVSSNEYKKNPKQAIPEKAVSDGFALLSSDDFEGSSHDKITEKIYTIFQNLQFGKDTLNASINYLTLSDSEREIVTAYLSPKSFIASATCFPLRSFSSYS